VLSDRQLWTRSALVIAVFAAVAVYAFLHGERKPVAPASAVRPAPAASRNLPAAGESHRYRLCLNDMAAGELTTSLATVTKGGRDSLEFSYTLVPTGTLQYLWHYKLTGSTLMDPRTLRARSGSFTSRSGDHDKTVSVVFGPSADTATVTVSKPYKQSVKRKQVPIGSSLDSPAALLLLRTADWTGQPARFHVLNGEDLYQWTVHYEGQEQIKVPAGDFEADALAVETCEMNLKATGGPAPKDESKTVRVWLDHATGIPVRIQADMSLGTFQADLE
jgi:hypothetical protein